MTTPERLRDAATHVASGNGDTLTELGEYGILINGQWLKTGHAIEVRSPYDDSVVAISHHGGPKEVETAIAAMVEAFQTTRKMPSWQRAEILEKISAGIAERHEEFSRIIALEAGKPLKAARAEVTRASFTFKVAAEEAKRIYGEIVPLDWMPGTEGRFALIQRVPMGPVVGISPFNYPLNLVAHKVAPALAAGNPIIVRPASQTPVSSLKLGELALEAGWPAEGMAVVPTSVPDAAPFVEDDRIKKLTFTGSPAVGWMLKSKAGR
ncbi:MAG: aldehyde dehydrogenase family protein, partial [Anaerolineae bacterium]|nr:aldehyde dehydrogenase family protein [Anaerolineae bacterium]